MRSIAVAAVLAACVVAVIAAPPPYEACPDNSKFFGPAVISNAANAPQPCSGHGKIHARVFCACDPGFFGKCCEYSIDFCAAYNGGCDEHATCTQTFGDRTCTCNDGFSGDGLECRDSTPPVLTLKGDSTVMIPQYSAYDDLGATSVDNLDGDISGAIVQTNNVNTHFPGSYTVTFVSTDAALNKATAVRTVIVSDVDECALPADNPYHHQCHAHADCANTNGGYKCTCQFGYSGDGKACQDIMAPIITINSLSDVTLFQYDPYMTPDASATDNSGEAIVVSSKSNIDAKVPGKYTVVYSASDSAGNQATATLNVEVVDIDECLLKNDKKLNIRGCSDYAKCTNTIGSFTCACNAGFSGDGFNCVDITPPVVRSAVPVVSVSQYSDSSIIAGMFGVTSSDNLDGDITASIKRSGSVDTTVPREYTLTFTSTDATGNTGILTVKAIVTDVDECAEKTATWKNNCNYFASCKNTIGSFECKCDDGFRGNGVTCDDITPPEVELKGEATIVVEQFTSFSDPGATARDNKDGDVSKSISVQGSVDANTAGDYTLTYSATDAAGNVGTTTRVVSVQDIDECTLAEANLHAAKCDRNAYCVNRKSTYDCICNDGFSGNGKTCADVTPPVIVPSTFEVHINQYDVFTVPIARATDNYDGDISSKIKVVSNVNTALAGWYTVTYSVTDAAGNQAQDKTIDIEVRDIDECTRTDARKHDCSPYATCTNTISSFVCTCNVGFSGNGKTCRDVTSPIISVDTTPISIRQYSSLTVPVARASDNLDGDISSKIAVSNTVNTKVVGTYSIRYDVMDAAGNAAASQRISVTVTDIDECAIPNPAIYPSCHPQAICRNTQGSYTCTCATGFTGDGIRSCVDTTAPTISLLGQSTVTITQAISWLPANAYVDAGATASDNFDGTITNKIVRSGSVDVRTVGTYRINFDVSDAAGNAATRVTRTVIVQDVNECDTARLTYDGTKNTPAGCDQYTTCVNNVGSYSCTPCPAGFTGTGQTSCKSISCQYSTYWSDCQVFGQPSCNFGGSPTNPEACSGLGGVLRDGAKSCGFAYTGCQLECRIVTNAPCNCGYQEYWSSNCGIADLGLSSDSYARTCSDGGELISQYSCYTVFNSWSRSCGILGCQSMCRKVVCQK